jgi:hemin uptake protein HemP
MNGDDASDATRGPAAGVPPEGTQPPADAARVIRSEEIFAGRRTVVIQHADVQYRLLITRNDRLILQK